MDKTTALLRFQKGDGQRAPPVDPYADRAIAFDGLARVTVDAKAIPGLSSAEFSTVIESDRPIVVDRLMTWDASGYGSHAETAIAAPSTTWYLAEGATHHNFSLFYLVQNPNATSVPVTVTYLLPAPAAPLTKVYTVPAQSRFNIWVNNEGATDPALAALAATDVSAVITAPQPILVERAMYLNQAGPDGQFGTTDDVLFNAGHESAGVTAPALSWFLAEGATGPYFDEFLLIANPGPTDAQVEARYLLVDGTVLTKTYVVPAQSRFNIWVNEEEFPGQGKALADAALSATLTSTNGVPIIVERAMWWPRPSPVLDGSAQLRGTTATGTTWGLAEGEVGGPFATETYILIANTSPFAGTARVTLVDRGRWHAGRRRAAARQQPHQRARDRELVPGDHREALRRAHREHRRHTCPDRRRARDVLGRQRHPLGRWQQRHGDTARALTVTGAGVARMDVAEASSMTAHRRGTDGSRHAPGS